MEEELKCSNLFVYGTLLAEELVRLLINRVPRSCAALLPDYHRCGVHNRDYPAAKYMKGQELQGKLLMDLTQAELQILDGYEGGEYTKFTVRPLLQQDQSQEVTSLIYVWANPTDQDLFGSWDYEEWRSLKLHKYEDLCQQFVTTGLHEFGGNST